MRILKEPLLHFLLILAGLCVMFARVRDPEPDRVDHILVSADDISQMANLWTHSAPKPES